MLDLATTFADQMTRYPCLGWTVFWRISQVAIAHDPLCDLLDANGFASYRPTSPLPKRALAQTVRAWLRATGRAKRLGMQRRDDQTEERVLLREVPSANREWLCFAFVREAADAYAQALAHATDLRFALHIPSRTIYVTRTRAGEISDALADAPLTAEIRPFWYQYQDLHMGDEVSKILTSILAGIGGVSIRRKGGVYWVANLGDNLDHLMHVQSLIASLPTEGADLPWLITQPVLDDDHMRRQFARAVHDGLLDDIRAADASFTSEMERWVGRPWRPQTLVKQLDAARQTAARANAYADLLAMDRTEITQAMATLQAKMAAAIMVACEARGEDAPDDIQALAQPQGGVR